MESTDLQAIVASPEATRVLIELFVNHGRAYHRDAATFQTGAHFGPWRDLFIKAKLVHPGEDNFQLTDLGKTLGYGLLEKDNLDKRHGNSLSDPVDIPLSPASIYAGKNIVDIGCGSGCYANDASLLGAKTVIGIDVQFPLLQVGHILRGTSHALFLAGFAECLPIGAATTDTVILRGALPYIDNDWLLSEAARISRPGSVLLITGLGPGYFISALLNSLTQLKPIRAFYLVVVIANSLLFALSGHRLPFKIKKYFSRELVSIFHTKMGLRRVLAKHGYSISTYKSHKIFGFCSHFFVHTTRL
ncbi:MAG TPA: hypothetical protein DEQ20_10555 [Desulfobulbaceae bacterium]|nr:MAG: hypothetical protein A2520_06440 [Deltaproteobacteria bacterium RIFOXYD12_FULL_53_23]HCC55342.1 hypothetical protein [Desulfobulbaceae bacterium]